VSSGILMEMTVEEVEAFNTEVVVIGVGSTEPHGPHLPYGTARASSAGPSNWPTPAAPGR